ncbi:hypothetical protein B0H19DRAFT_1059733 [Mycena capillaripes]|nr:hypothetical protein B0H19DRAFT_1059733 [Mycena capillaripes]
MHGKMNTESTLLSVQHMSSRRTVLDESTNLNTTTDLAGQVPKGALKSAQRRLEERQKLAKISKMMRSRDADPKPGRGFEPAKLNQRLESANSKTCESQAHAVLYSDSTVPATTYVQAPHLTEVRLANLIFGSITSPHCVGSRLGNSRESSCRRRRSARYLHQSRSVPDRACEFKRPGRIRTLQSFAAVFELGFKTLRRRAKVQL